MGEKEKESDSDFVKSIDSATEHFAERLAEGPKSQAIVPSGSSGVVKSEGESRVLPRLNFGVRRVTKTTPLPSSPLVA